MKSILKCSVLFFVLFCVCQANFLDAQQTRQPRPHSQGHMIRVLSDAESFTPQRGAASFFSFSSGKGRLEFNDVDVNLSSVDPDSPQLERGAGRHERKYRIDVRRVEIGFDEKKMTLLGEVHRFGPERLVFNSPALLTLPYVCPDGFPEDLIQIYYHNAENDTWQIIPKISQDKIRRTITAKISHFSDYVAGIGNSRSPDIGSPDSGIPLGGSTTVDPYSGTLLMKVPLASVPSRGVDISLNSLFNSDSLYRSILPTDGAAGSCVASDLQAPYPFAAGWNYDLPACQYGGQNQLILVLPHGQKYNMESALSAIASSAASPTNVESYRVEWSGTTGTIRIPFEKLNITFQFSRTAQYVYIPPVYGDSGEHGVVLISPGYNQFVGYTAAVVSGTLRLYYSDGKVAVFNDSTGQISSLWDPANRNRLIFTYTNGALTRIQHTDNRCIKILSYVDTYNPSGTSESGTSYVYLLSNSLEPSELKKEDIFLEKVFVNSLNRLRYISTVDTLTRSTDITNFTLSAANASTYFSNLQTTVFNYSISTNVTNDVVSIIQPGGAKTEYLFAPSFFKRLDSSYDVVTWVGSADGDWVTITHYVKKWVNKPKLQTVKIKETANVNDFIKAYSFEYSSICNKLKFTSSDITDRIDNNLLYANIYPTKTVHGMYKGLAQGAWMPVLATQYDLSTDTGLSNKPYMGVGAIWRTRCLENGQYTSYDATVNTYVRSSAVEGCYDVSSSSYYRGSPLSIQYTISNNYDAYGRLTKTENSRTGSTYFQYLNNYDPYTKFGSNPYNTSNAFEGNITKGFGIISGIVRDVNASPAQSSIIYLKYSNGTGSSPNDYGLLNLLQKEEVVKSANDQDTKYLHTSYSYDSQNTNLIKQVQFPSGNYIDFFVGSSGYEQSYINRVTQAINNSDDTQYIHKIFTHDLKGRITTTTQKMTVLEPENSALYNQNAAPSIVRSMTYDGLDRYLVVTRDGDATKRISKSIYDDQNRIATITDGIGYRTKILFDTFNRAVSRKTYKPSVATDALFGNGATEVLTGWEEYSYNPVYLNNRASETTYLDVTGGSINAFIRTKKYDELGRLISITSKKGSDSERVLENIFYDDNTNTIFESKTAEDGKWISTITKRDWLDRTIEFDTFEDKFPSNPATIATYFSYDKGGRLIQKLLPNGDKYIYAYRTDGMLEKITFPDNLIEYYTYDGNKNITDIMDRKSINTHFSYNFANLANLIEIGGTTDKTQIKTNYCHLGELSVTITDFTNPSETYAVAYEYDQCGKMKKKSQQIDSVASGRKQSIGLAYDIVGNPISLSVDSSVNGTSVYSKALTYIPQYLNIGGDFDNWNKYAVKYNNSTVLAMSTTFWGSTKNISTGGRLSTYSNYDYLMRPQTITHPDAETLQYAYDYLGNVVSRTIGIGDLEQYWYDGMSRLKTEPTGTYSYDSLGNILSKTGSGPELNINKNYTYVTSPSNVQSRLVSLNTTGQTLKTYMSDNNGNPSPGQFSSINYNYFNQISKISKTDGTYEKYYYDKSGLRYKKKEYNASETLTTTTYALYWGNDLILEEQNQGTTQTRKDTRLNLYLAGMNLARFTKDYSTNLEAFQYFYLDIIGSRRTVVDTNGALQAKFYYSPWGVETLTTYNNYVSSRDYSFTSKSKDSTGLVYFNARYYDPILGRFLTEDPKRDGNNWYAYCGNNPLRFTDPTGLYANNEDTAIISEIYKGPALDKVDSNYYEKRDWFSFSNPNSKKTPNPASPDFNPAIYELGMFYSDIIGKIWASPVTAIGLIVGANAYMISIRNGLGGRINFRNNAITFTTGLGSGSSVTLGNVIIHWCGDITKWNPDENTPRYDLKGLVNIGKHEEMHTYQYQELGVFFLVEWLGNYISTRDIGKSRLEIEADDYSEVAKYQF